MNYPPAIQHRGPADKIWPDANARAGVILHSMEGFIGPALAELDNESVQLSWHFSVAADGTVYQHYDLEQSPWHAGTHAQNARLIGVEHEGVQGTPLTEPQIAASLALVEWIGEQCGWPLVRDGANKTLWEHHEVPGANTTCPNGRIPWSRYMPDANHADNYDIGLERLQLEAMLRVIRDEHARAGGDKQVLKDILDGTR